ncbi:lipoxygenase homology domain-containing protein 1-like isoform X2 [Acanthaster planci]|uniref:Lipoxygenase homology domain-containing protein 1-like isoform X2 n=1 Tax=Acanthaster planci TaxID=133434 RepID=A0A8B7YS42_ACAPL|nr:lipoxygenase homology domain-containing protein 1-like isoform X2 [Acanthaster planci]
MMNSIAVWDAMAGGSTSVARPVRTLDPRPPYAVDRPRPQSAPMRKPVSPAKPLWRDSRSDIIPHKQRRFVTSLRSSSANQDSYVSKRAPYAAKRLHALNVERQMMTGTYPRVENGRTVTVPEYDAFADPHLTDYFARKFSIGLPRPPSGAKRRPASANARTSTGRSGSRQSTGLECMYRVTVKTGDKKNCGTAASVFIQLKGSKGKTAKRKLSKKSAKTQSGFMKIKYSRNTSKVFKLKMQDVGELQTLTVEHDGLEKADSWFLEEIEVTNLASKQTWLFHCGQWLSLFETDCQLRRVLKALDPKKHGKTEYEVVTVTGDVKGAGSDSNVYITLFGMRGTSKKTPLKPQPGADPFERGNSDVFTFKCNNVGPLRKIRIEHDNTGFAPGWFLDRVVVTDLSNPKKGKYYFPCGQWLAKGEGDGLICRDLLGSRDPLAVRKSHKYKVHIFTGNKRGAGTDSNVFVTIFGESGEDSGERKLTNSKNNFERGREDVFVLEAAALGPLEKIRIGHDNSGPGPAWFLDKVIIDDIEMGATYEFPCKRWLAKNEDDGKITRELYCGDKAGKGSEKGIPYEVRITTSDKRGAGTDARVYIVMYGGKNGEQTSGKIWLDDGKFDRGRTDICSVEIGAILSPLSRLDIGHDNSGVGAGWHLQKVVIDCPAAGIEQTFLCNDWLADDEGDKRIERTLTESKSMRKTKKQKEVWNVTVFTSDVASAGTDANVYFCLYGDQGKSDEIKLDNKSDNFERGQQDSFKIEMVPVGKPYKMRVWHDNKGMAAGWHLEKIEIQPVSSKKCYIFPCNRWLAKSEDDGEIIRELPATGDSIKKPLPLVKYKVLVHTADKFGAGTNANVFCNIFGELGDTGERPLSKSATNRNKFERKSVDEFIIEAVSLRALKKIRVGHDGTGAGAGWMLDKVVVQQEGRPNSEVVFPCKRWLDRDEDDGQIVRELVPEGNSQLLSTTSYHVSVKTGDERSAGTDANVHIKLFGEDGDTGLIPLKQSENTKNKFERGRTDKFTLEAVDIGKLEYIKISHDGSGPGAGWFLDSVEVDIPSRGLTYTFASHRWLAEDEEDGELEVELYPTDTKKTKPRIPYEITVVTGSCSGAGTDANVFLRIYGEDGAKTEEFNLRNRTDNFEKNNVDKFKIEAEDVGPISKIRIGHDGAGRFAGWFLDRVQIERFPPKKRLKRRKSRSKMRLPSDEEDDDGNGRSQRRRSKSRTRLQSDDDDEKEDDGKVVDESQETTKYLFVCNRWLARSEDDGQIVRELVPTDESGNVLKKNSLKMCDYVIHTYTGDVFQAGTDANVFINIYGEKGDTGERRLKDSETNMNKFERNQEDIFKMEAADLGGLKKLKIRHDNSGPGANWFLDRVEVEDKMHNRRYYFPCQRWLATNKDDGQISRDLIPVEKEVIQRSLSRRRSSTSVREEIALEAKASMETYHVYVTTADVRGAGTDANVYVVLYGENDDTGQHFLKSSKTNRDKFERGKTDEFIIEAVDIGEIQKIKIGHDNKGGFAGWKLDKVEIDAPSLGKRWYFPCGRWLDKGEDDGQIERILHPVETRTEEYQKHVPYEFTVYTSDVSGAGTDSDVFVTLYGQEVVTSQKSLCQTKKQRKECFERNQVDKFVIELEDVGETIEKLRIGHDNAGFGAAWHLNKVEVRRLLENSKGSRTYVFPCNRWLSRKEDDGEIIRELVPAQITEEKVRKDGSTKKKEVKQDTLTMKKYAVQVYTGDVFRAGTDANVFCTLFGENGDSGERQLRNSETYTDKFERGHCDKFSFEAADLGKPFKLKIRHDNTGFSAAWFLDRVEVIDHDGEKYVFHCERWLGKNKDDGKLERTLYAKGYEGDMSSTSTLHRSKSSGSLKSVRSDSPGPLTRRKSMLEMPEFTGPTIPYTIRVTTGKEPDMGTDANIYIVISGPKKKHTTGRLPLQLVSKSKLEPGSIETFSLEAPDVTDIKKIEIGHDGVTPQEGWYLEEIEVDMPTLGRHYCFPCKRWLSKDKDDGHISRVLVSEDAQSANYKPKIPYEVTFFTGDVQNAGTDAVITMTVFGTNGSTPELTLDKNGERFERGKEDLIKTELDDIAPLKKIRIGHNGKGSRPDWYLDKVHLRNMETGDLTVFKCEDWLSKTHSDKKIVRELPAYVKGKAQIQNINYKVTVKTSDIRGCGTDANVCLIIFGENGSSEELKLKESQTHRDKFERNQADIFSFSMLSLGTLTKIRIWHDNKGLKAGWHLEYVEIVDESKNQTYMFPCNRWLARDEDDKQIMRELTCASLNTPRDDKEKITYEISVTTTDKRDAGTTQNAWVILEGDLRSSREFVMENSAKKKILRKGDTDTFKFSTRNVGRIDSILLGHRERNEGPTPKGTGREVDWHCHEVVVMDTSLGTKYTFPCKGWVPLGFGKDSAMRLNCKKVDEGKMAAARNLAPVRYEVVVVTANEKGAGTDANVQITIYGSNGDSGRQPLKQRFRDLFEKGQTDKFTLEVLDLGDLNKVRIEHDNKGFNAGWLCDHVTITNLATGKQALFPCNKWLDKSKGDGELFKELYPAAN